MSGTKLMICNQALTAGHFWAKDKIEARGWILVKNLSTFSRLEIHFDNDSDDYQAETVKPLHTRPFRVDEGDQIGYAHVATNQYVKVTFSREKPTVDEWFNDESGVENVPFHVDNVAVTTTYAFNNPALFPLIRKGFITHLQVTADGAGFGGTVAISNDGAIAYSNPAIVTSTDPTKLIYYQENLVMTHVRVTRVGGTFSLEAY